MPILSLPNKVQAVGPQPIKPSCRAVLFSAAIFLASVLSVSTAVAAPGQELCVYIDSAGVERRVFGRSNVPIESQAGAQCAPGDASSFLAAPDDIKLNGTIRREEIASSVGPIELRWPRKVELLFGRTPQRAMADAANTVSRALRGASFPIELQTLRLPWQVVFMDEDLPETQIPYQLISNCHPAWMTPPANLYIVSQRVVAGCGGQRRSSQVADSDLLTILLHEMGHAIEAALLKENMSGDRFRAEGFATWFQQYASQYSSVIPKGSVEKEYLQYARQAVQAGVNPNSFGGSVLDYALASQYFRAIVDRRGVRGLMDVYSLMSKERVAFPAAVDRALSWDPARFHKEVERMLQSG